ncbi:MAG TPA: creatininase family protein [Gaiellaceae bacterium]|nr:creatininase family protein [Gaiellaceae bacterium]HWJ44635.1 creatininase family protein [Gaiellaceae bacterium]
MRVRELNWMQLEDYLQRDDRIVLPVGSTEQHAYLSLETDNIIAERLAAEAAEPLGVPVLPVLAYGIAPGFGAYPGSPTLRIETFIAVVREILESLYGQGFRRFAIVNGHGGNTSAREAVMGWMDEHDDAVVLWSEAWDGRPDEIAAAIDRDYDHASWSENFPWTRLEGVELPAERKPPFTRPKWSRPKAWREALGDGSFGGPYQLPDEDVLSVWNAAVEQLRETLASGWP